MKKKMKLAIVEQEDSEGVSVKMCSGKRKNDDFLDDLWDAPFSGGKGSSGEGGGGGSQAKRRRTGSYLRICLVGLVVLVRCEIRWGSPHVGYGALSRSVTFAHCAVIREQGCQGSVDSFFATRHASCLHEHVVAWSVFGNAAGSLRLSAGIRHGSHKVTAGVGALPTEAVQGTRQVYH